MSFEGVRATEIFDPAAAEYDAWYDTGIGSLVHRVEREVVFDLLRPRPGQKALDFGCGTGRYAIDLARMGLVVTGLDISEVMLAYARKKSEDLGLRVHWVVHDAQQLPFEEGSFDLAVSVTALEFFPEPGRALEEAYRVLKPGGRMVVGVIGGNSSWSEKYLRNAKEEEDSVFKHATFYTAEELLALMPEVPGRARRALYFPPGRESFDREQALAVEKEGRIQNRDGAGFVAAAWEK